MVSRRPDRFLMFFDHFGFPDLVVRCPAGSAEEVGCVAFLLKPFFVNDIVEVLNRSST
jgi:hypothetical protein